MATSEADRSRAGEIGPGAEDQAIVFVHSLMPRSGTNYLANLLAIHPDCALGAIDEDGLLGRSHNLVRFANQLVRIWKGNGDYEPLAPFDPAGRLLRHFGRAMRSFLVDMQDAMDKPRPAVIVTKTPSTRNIETFSALFPDDRTIVLIRDGKAVVESLDRSFGYGFEQATRDWAAAARHFIAASPGLPQDRVLVVRYEELVLDTGAITDRLLGFIGLDPALYDHARASALPVIGSSDLTRGGGQVDWLPREKGSDFNPLSRYEHWSKRKHSRFEWLAGREMRQLHYSETGNAPASRMVLWNRWRDVIWQLRRLGGILLSLPAVTRRARRILADEL